MAVITDYGTLRTAIADYVTRDDLTSWVPNFIQAAEERIYNEMRVRQMETALSDTISSGVIAVPTGYLELKNLYVDSNPVTRLTRIPLEDMYSRYPTRQTSGLPKFFAREASNFIFGPYPDSDYDVKGVFYKRLTALSDDNTTNWLTDDYPNLILYASLLEAALFVKNEAEARRWELKFQEQKSQVERLERREKGSGSSLSVRAG